LNKLASVYDARRQATSMQRFRQWANDMHSKVQGPDLPPFV
jgi:hypothetical protein